MIISAIIPTKNEEKTIENIVKKTLKYVDEVLVIDGHSEDNTVILAKRAGAKVILDDGKGKGAAMRLGIKVAQGDILVFLDADGSHDPDDIPKLVQPIINDEADMVIGSRFKGGSDELVGNLNQLFRITGSNIITTFINYKWKVHLTDTQNGFRAIKKSVAVQLNLTVNGFPIETQMDMEVLRHGFRITEVPSHEYRRAAGESKIKLLKIWYQYPLLMLKYLFMKSLK